MIVRIALLFLLAMLLFRIVGKWLRPRVPPKPRTPVIEPARKCTICDTYLVGGAATRCGRADCPNT